MATSLYKGQRLGKRPPCLICMGPGRGERAELQLPGGVSVWLCAMHRSAEFRTRRAGRDLSLSLMRAWQAAGCFTARRRRALDALEARLGARPARPRPGSYAWPALRREAERRFAAGEAPRRVIDDLRARAGRGPANPPSLRTMLRWLAEGRWLDRAGSPSGGGELDGGQGERLPAAVADDPELHGAPDAVGAHQPLQVADVGDGDAVHVHDEVLGAQPGPLGGALGDHLDHLDAGLAAQGAGDAGRQRARAAGDADVGAPDAPLAHQRGDDRAGWSR